MRKLNVLLTIAILALLAAHGICGGFQAMGVLPGGNDLLTVLAWIMIVLICLHMVVSLIYTAQTLQALKKSEKSYFRANTLFWARRISGFAVVLFVFFHVLIFMGGGSGTRYRLNFFGDAQLVSQILLIVTIAVHVLCNMKPLFISCGARRFREYLKDILLIIGVLLLFAGAAMVIYYLRWNMLWRY